MMGHAIRPLVALLVPIAIALSTLTMADGARAAGRFGFCGVIKAFTPATQSQAGSLTVGTRTFELAPGVQPGGTHPIVVGAGRCVAGDQDASGRFTSVAAEASFLEEACGMVSELRPATASTTGSLVLNGFRLVLIRAGTQLPADSASGFHCFAQVVSAEGDALVVGTIAPPPGHALAPVATPALTGLPSTSSADAAEASSVAAGALPVSATRSVEGNPPRLLIAVLAVGALSAAAVARRRLRYR